MWTNVNVGYQNLEKRKNAINIPHSLLLHILLGTIL